MHNASCWYEKSVCAQLSAGCAASPAHSSRPLSLTQCLRRCIKRTLGYWAPNAVPSPALPQWPQRSTTTMPYVCQSQTLARAHGRLKAPSLPAPVRAVPTWTCTLLCRHAHSSPAISQGCSCSACSPPIQKAVLSSPRWPYTPRQLPQAAFSGLRTAQRYGQGLKQLSGWRGTQTPLGASTQVLSAGQCSYMARQGSVKSGSQCSSCALQVLNPSSSCTEVCPHAVGGRAARAATPALASSSA